MFRVLRLLALLGPALRPPASQCAPGLRDVYAGRHASSPAVTDNTARLNNTLSPTERESFVDRFDVGSFFKSDADKIGGEIELKG